MVKKRSPQEKKRDAYHKEHRNESEYPHAFRRQWPQKKARHQRRFRRKVKQALHTYQDTPTQDASEVETIQRKSLQKWGTQTLAQRVEHTLQLRIVRIAYNFFKSPYQREKHQEGFARFLHSLIEGQSTYTQRIAAHFHTILHAPPHSRWHHKRTWLEAFFQDEPNLQQTFLSWLQTRT